MQPKRPDCFGTGASYRPQEQAENCCDDCPNSADCFAADAEEKRKLRISMGNRIISIPYSDLKVLLTEHLRAEECFLPVDYEIVSIKDNFFTNSLDIKIADPSSPPIERGMMLPTVIARY